MSFRLGNFVLRPTHNFENALQCVKGIGPFQARRICKRFGINPHSKVQDVGSEVLPEIHQVMEREFITGQQVDDIMGKNIKRMVDIGIVRGIRHIQCLPCNGQRTRTNAQTQKKLGAIRKAQFNLGRGPREAWTKAEIDADAKRETARLHERLRKGSAGNKRA